MLKAKTPYFLTNKEWYYYDMKTGRYKLTDKAPEKAIESYRITPEQKDLLRGMKL